MALRRTAISLASRLGGVQQPGLAAICTLREPWVTHLSQRDGEQQQRLPVGLTSQLPFSARGAQAGLHVQAWQRASEELGEAE